jgi:predicted component of viral defense system (DUF524 family)
MADFKSEASLEILDQERHFRADLLIRPSAHTKFNTLLEITADEAEEWGEERIQLLEECRYEYEIRSKESLKLREIPNIISRSALPNRLNTGIIEPKSNVGLFPIVVEDHEGNLIAETAVEIRSAKLEYREHYRKMLDYIADRTTDLLIQIRSPSQGRFRPKFTEPSQTIAQRFAFIKSLISNKEFQSATSRIISDPHVRSSVQEREHELNRGFKPNWFTLRQLGSGHPRIKTDEHTKLHAILPSIPKNIIVREHRETKDTPENRFIKHVFESFDLFLNDMANVLEGRLKNHSDERLLNEIISLRKKIAAPLSHNLFRSLSKPAFLPLGSPVLQRREGYREILLAWLKFDAASRIVWTGGNDVYGSGKKDVATLYEYWIFFKLLDVVSSVFKLKPPKTSDLIEETDDGFSLKLKAGQRLLIEGISNFESRPLKIRFAYNRTFSIDKIDSEISYPASGTWTRSLRPDYSLSVWPAELESDEAEDLELMWHIHFDAKYKIDQKHGDVPNINDMLGIDSDAEILNKIQSQHQNGSAKRTDLMTMHAYRDAIRRTEGAYIIYPGNENLKWRKYYEILPGLGAFSVNPGSEKSGLDHIHRFLMDVATHIRNRATLRERERFYSHLVQRGAASKEVFQPIPDITENGERAKPVHDHLVLFCDYLGKEHIEWVLKSGTINIALEQGYINHRYFLIEHIIILNGQDIAIGPLKVDNNNNSKIQTGSELLKQDCPHIQDPETVYAVFSITLETRKLFKKINWTANYEHTILKPYICSLEEVIG